MNSSSETTRLGREPAGRAAQLAQNDKPAKIQILHDVTNDSPDSQPWPPPETDVLWSVVRRAEGCTLWRAIQLAQVRSAAADFCNSSRQQLQRKR
jgi:hypothetical protein